MDLSKHTRREFIRLTGIAAAGMAVAACAPEPEIVEKIVKETVVVEKEVEREVIVEKEVVVEKEVEVEVAPPPSKYGESPVLASRVARGELPPVEERLPEDPLIIPVHERIGDYGGTVTLGTLRMEPVGWGDIRMFMGDHGANWLRIGHDASYAEPNFLQDWEMSDDFTEITCYMRKGIRFSDGAPCTSEAIRFWYEDHLTNPEITPMPNRNLRPGGELFELTIIDDYTFKLNFAVPYPGFVLACMAHYQGTSHVFAPHHYLKQYHIKYNPDADKLAQEEGYDYWYQNYLRRWDAQWTMDRPRFTPYVPVRDTPSIVFFERNPYYYGVDPEGNQLPYIDKVNSDRCADLSVLDAKTVGGAYDFVGFETRILLFPTYADGANLSDARMILWPSGRPAEVVYHVNMNYEEDEMREVFADKRFRQALSLAINRPEINDIIFFGNAEESQFSVLPTSRHYKPEYAQAYAEYDPDRANALLDEMGLEWNAAGTHRLWPESKTPILIAWNFIEIETPRGPITELVAEYWQDIGIEIQWKTITRPLLSQRIGANEEPMSLWHGAEVMDTLFLNRPYMFAPIDGDTSCWGVLWGRWYNTGGEMGEEPPQEIKELYDWHDEFKVTHDTEPARKLLESQAENVWTIGTVGNAPHPLFVRNNLRNITETGGFWSWDCLWSFPEYPEQWFIEA